MPYVGMDPDTNSHADTVRRAALPEVMFVPDVALALQVSFPTARLCIRRGDCGPHFRIGRKLAVLRESFLDALSAGRDGEQPWEVLHG